MKRDGAEIEHILPAASDAEIIEIEARVGVQLPEAYKRLLRCARGFWLLGGAIQFGTQHPFFHTFEPLDKLTPMQRQVVSSRGGAWPPPSQGMLCFAEFFMEADGDQVLWDVSGGMRGGEYSIYYYAHEASPASVRKLSDNFQDWLGEFLGYRDFSLEDDN
jgi:hypothetical protein